MSLRLNCKRLLLHLGSYALRAPLFFVLACGNWCDARPQHCQAQRESPSRGAGQTPSEREQIAAQEQSAAPISGVSIHDIQGVGYRSPLEGSSVAAVRGVVTQVDNRGFFMQEPEPDDDARTSEAVFVHLGTLPPPQVGQLVQVSGQVAEWRPRCQQCTEQDAQALLSSTELTAVHELDVVASEADIPWPAALGAEQALPQLFAQQAVDLEQPDVVLQPERYVLDLLESLEGMHLELGRPVVTQATRGAHFWVAPLDVEHDATSLRLSVDQAATYSRGERFAQALSGVLSLRDGVPHLLTRSALPSVSPPATPVARWPAPSDGELSFATLNAHNLALSDSAAKFEALAQVLVRELHAPDLLAMQEVQDDSAERDDGVVSAAQTLEVLLQHVEAAGGPRYEALSIEPEDGQDGGEPGANIRQVLLFHAARGLHWRKQLGATATTGNAVTRAAHLLYSPGRVAPTAAAFAHSRKPLAAEFEFQGQRVFVLANHWLSRRGDQPWHGRHQPPLQHSEPQRIAQAQLVADFVKELQQAAPASCIVVLGDLNEVPGSAVLHELSAVGLTSVHELAELPPYTYVYQGRGQALDHVLLSEAWLGRVQRAGPLNLLSGVPNAVSDHDPVLARVRFSSE